MHPQPNLWMALDPMSKRQPQNSRTMTDKSCAEQGGKVSGDRIYNFLGFKCWGLGIIFVTLITPPITCSDSDKLHLVSFFDWNVMMDSI